MFPERSGKAPVEMVKISKGRVVRAFDWWNFGWVCIALALGAEMHRQQGMYTVVLEHARRRRTR